jgi:hypothetical protein
MHMSTVSQPVHKTDQQLINAIFRKFNPHNQVCSLFIIQHCAGEAMANPSIQPLPYGVSESATARQVALMTFDHFKNAIIENHAVMKAGPDPQEHVVKIFRILFQRSLSTMPSSISMTTVVGLIQHDFIKNSWDGQIIRHALPLDKALKAKLIQHPSGNLMYILNEFHRPTPIIDAVALFHKKIDARLNLEALITYQNQLSLVDNWTQAFGPLVTGFQRRHVPASCS